MLRLLKYAVLIAIVVGATVATTMVFMNMSQASNVALPEQEPIVVADPIFAEFAPFTVTLYGENRNRILYTTITLRLKDEKSRDILNKYMPEARDRILKTLSSINQDNIKTAREREDLANELKHTLSREYSEDLPRPNIKDVLFTAFVVQ